MFKFSPWFSSKQIDLEMSGYKEIDIQEANKQISNNDMYSCSWHYKFTSLINKEKDSNLLKIKCFMQKIKCLDVCNTLPFYNAITICEKNKLNYAYSKNKRLVTLEAFYQNMPEYQYEDIINFANNLFKKYKIIFPNFLWEIYLRWKKFEDINFEPYDNNTFGAEITNLLLLHENEFEQRPTIFRLLEQLKKNNCISPSLSKAVPFAFGPIAGDIIWAYNDGQKDFIYCSSIYQGGKIGIYINKFPIK